jgi:hypothetical protein
MKKLLLSTLVLFFLISCKEEPQQQVTKSNYKAPVITDTIEHFRIVKNVKQDNETSTSYHYRYDWLSGKFRQQPRIQSETKYYIIYTDGTSEETTKRKGMFYEKGDTVKYYSYTYK